MMNPQYMPPGQNNNTPSNPLGYPSNSQEFNGIQNANIYSQNGPQMPPSQDVTQKMQNMNLNGPGFPNMPSSQLPPGQIPPGQVPPNQMPPGFNFPPTSNFSGQLPPNAFNRPPVSGSHFGPSSIAQKPPMSTPGPETSNPGFIHPPPSQTPNMDQSKFGQTPSGPKPSSAQPSQAPFNQSGLGPQPGQQQSQQGLPSQSGVPPKPLAGPHSGPPPNSMSQPQIGPGVQSSGLLGQGPQSGLHQSGLPGQGLPQHSQGVMPLRQPGFPLSNQPGMPSQATPISRPSGPPSQSGQMSNQPGLPPSSLSQQSQMPGNLGQPPKQSQMPGNLGQPPQQSLPSQLNTTQSLPGFPSQTGQMSSQPGLPPQSGQISSSTSQSLQSQPGLPPRGGHIPNRPGLLPQGQPPQGQLLQDQPPQPGQLPGLSSLPSQSGQSIQPVMSSHPGQLPSQPGFPPHSSSLPDHPGLPPQAGQIPAQFGLPASSGMPPQPQIPSSQMQYQQMQGLPHMPPPISQQRQYPGMPPVNQQTGFGALPGGSYPGMPPMSTPQQQPMAGQQMGYQSQSGYPPQPGYQQPPFPAQQPGYPGQQVAQKRLDPDQMPSPIQVMADDQQNRGGIFVTNDKGLVPPLVTTNFIVDDKGNASPRFIRSSMYNIPVTADLLKQTSMPFCLVIAPMAETISTEEEPPLLDFAALTGSPTMGPVRCSRCKAYMCPSMKFIDAGRHFKCAFCKATTEVPMEYTQYINSMQQYGRVPAEMALGAYEIVATKEYCRNNTLPNPPAIVFVIDVSYNAIKSGLVHTVCANILEIIEMMPKDKQTGKSHTRVGFITYSSTVHFYNIKGSLAQPQMMSVGDVGDMFVPLLEGFLVLPEESGPVLQALLQQLPNMFIDNKETEIILLPAVQAGLEALKAADTSGQLLVFHTSLPTFNAPGKLINREDRKLLGTDKEKQILTPQTTAYNELGQLCSAAGVSVELFVCNNAYVDAATIGQLCRLTGGQLHKYTYFTADVDGERLIEDCIRVVSRPTAHDAVMRVRTSTGVRATDFYGHFFMSNTTDIELAATDADKAVGIEIKHDDKLTGEDGVYIQAALLYTHRSGQRRLRVLNLALNVAHQLADVYRSTELDTIINFLTKQAVWALREHTPRNVRDGLSARCARSLAAYRRHCASPSSVGQLVLPESMKLLPLYTSCMLRSDAIAGGPDITCDDRSCAMYRALTADVATSVVYTYPRLLPLHQLADGKPPSPLRASMDKMNDQGVYLLENGVHMLLWVGSQAPAEFINTVFGVSSPQQIDTQVCELPQLDNALSSEVRAIVAHAREERHTAMRLTIMRQHDKLEAVLRHFLVEDRGVDGSASYVDYLCHIHKEIRAML